MKERFTPLVFKALEAGKLLSRERDRLLMFAFTPIHYLEEFVEDSQVSNQYWIGR